MEQLGSHWMDFSQNLKFQDFSKICEENEKSLKSDKNNGTLHEDCCIFFNHISLISS